MAAFVRTICSSGLTFITRIPFDCLQPARSLHTARGGLCFKATQFLCAEPPKKKKRVDPKMEIMRQQRMLKRMKKVQFKMGDPEHKPIEEFRTDRKLLTDDTRRRDSPTLPYEEQEQRALLQKTWARHKSQQHMTESHLIKTLHKSQQRALHELRVESEELYQSAIERDTNLFPFEVSGPVHTPPISGYTTNSPDGEYVDVTKQYK